MHYSSPLSRDGILFPKHFTVSLVETVCGTQVVLYETSAFEKRGKTTEQAKMMCKRNEM